MITKERLEELVKENRKVYYTQNHPLISDGMWIDLTRAKIIPSQECVTLDYKIYGSYGYVDCFPFKWLYETKEDAEEYLKYGNVKKTVELVMADWNDVKNTTYGYCGSFDDGTLFYTLNIKDGYVYVDMLDYYYSKHLQESKMCLIKCLFKKELNRENYNEARDLFVKLFMGDEE